MSGESQFNTHPQPRTFAPSKEVTLTPLLTLTLTLSLTLTLTLTNPNANANPNTDQDVLQNLQYFFGAPVSPEKLK